MRSLTVQTVPSVEPITLAEAKTHLRVDTTDDDTLIGVIITAARDLLEGMCGRAFVTQTLNLWLDGWPEGGTIVLPRPPLASVTSVTYYDTTDTPTVVDASTYHVDTNAEPGRIVLSFGKYWPAATLRPAHSVKIIYVAGYGLAIAVPERYKALLKLLVSHLYDQRELVGDGRTSYFTKLPLGVEALMGERFTDTLVEC